MFRQTLARTACVAAALLTLAVQISAAEPPADELKQWAKSHSEELVTLYRHFHAHPELSLLEKATAARVAAEWKAAGFEVTTGVGGHGVVALLKNGAGPAVMLRTDLDGLPVVENTGLAYASQVKVKDPSGAEIGVMHACGRANAPCATPNTARRRLGW